VHSSGVWRSYCDPFHICWAWRKVSKCDQAQVGRLTLSGRGRPRIAVFKKLTPVRSGAALLLTSPVL